MLSSYEGYNTEKTRLWNGQKKLWNMEYLYEWKNLQGTEKRINKFWTYLNHT